MLAGESPDDRNEITWNAQFQSAPTIAGGRICNPACACADATVFQSAPTIAGGRILGRAGCCSAHGLVSIRAHHCWRANRPLVSDLSLMTAVSIRAHHCWRANQGHRSITTSGGVFQSAPTIAGGRIFWPAHNVTSPGRFQSAPTIAGGRITKADIIKEIRACFNPRPPLLVGESKTFPKHKALIAVSIRAHHCWWANLYPPYLSRIARLFQSAPTIAGGRINGQGSRAAPCNGFNPRPPLLVGESSKAAGGSVH